MYLIFPPLFFITLLLPSTGPLTSVVARRAPPPPLYPLNTLLQCHRGVLHYPVHCLYVFLVDLVGGLIIAAEVFVLLRANPVDSSIAETGSTSVPGTPSFAIHSKKDLVTAGNYLTNMIVANYICSFVIVCLSTLYIKRKAWVRYRKEVQGHPVIMMVSENSLRAMQFFITTALLLFLPVIQIAINYALAAQAMAHANGILVSSAILDETVTTQAELQSMSDTLSQTHQQGASCYRLYRTTKGTFEVKYSVPTSAGMITSYTGSASVSLSPYFCYRNHFMYWGLQLLPMVALPLGLVALFDWVATKDIVNPMVMGLRVLVETSREIYSLDLIGIHRSKPTKEWWSRNATISIEESVANVVRTMTLLTRASFRGQSVMRALLLAEVEENAEMVREQGSDAEEANQTGGKGGFGDWNAIHPEFRDLHSVYFNAASLDEEQKVDALIAMFEQLGILDATDSTPKYGAFGGRQENVVKEEEEGESTFTTVETEESPNTESPTTVPEPPTTTRRTRMSDKAVVPNVRVNKSTLRNYIVAVRDRYLKNPYHQWEHAVDVTHTLFLILTKVETWARTYLTPLDVFCLMVGAVAHDMGHRGVSNDHICKVKDVLALTYNDISPQENLHCSMLFQMCAGDPMCDVFETLTPSQKYQARVLIVQLVLNTDMKMHFDRLGDLKLLLERHNGRIDQQGVGLGGGRGLTHEETTDIMVGMLKMADLGNCVRPLHMHVKWSIRVVNEFFGEAEIQRGVGIVPLPFMDPTVAYMPDAQTDFINFIISPFASTMVGLLPPLQTWILPCLATNHHFWTQLGWRHVTRSAKVGVPGSEVPSPHPWAFAGVHRIGLGLAEGLAEMGASGDSSRTKLTPTASHSEKSDPATSLRGDDSMLVKRRRFLSAAHTPMEKVRESEGEASEADADSALTGSERPSGMERTQSSNSNMTMNRMGSLLEDPEDVFEMMLGHLRGGGHIDRKKMVNAVVQSPLAMLRVSAMEEARVQAAARNIPPSHSSVEQSAGGSQPHFWSDPAQEETFGMVHAACQDLLRVVESLGVLEAPPSYTAARVTQKSTVLKNQLPTVTAEDVGNSK